MHQREKILRSFHDAKLNKSRKRKIKQFLKFLSENPNVCWEDTVKEFRQKYYEIIDDIVPPILATEDALIIANLLRCIDLKKKKELNHIKKFVRGANAFRNEDLFKIIARRYYPALEDVLLQKERLPRSVQSIISLKRRERELAKRKTKQGGYKKTKSHKTSPSGKI